VSNVALDPRVERMLSKDSRGVMMRMYQWKPLDGGGGESDAECETKIVSHRNDDAHIAELSFWHGNLLISHTTVLTLS